MKIRIITALFVVCSMLILSVASEDVVIDASAVLAETSQTLPSTDETFAEGENAEAEKDVIASKEQMNDEVGDAKVQQDTTNKTDKIVFSDVPADSSYAADVAKLVEYGIIDGYGDNTFRPENGITRAEMCKMINLTFNYVEYGETSGFPDVNAEDWYAPYVLAAQQAGYIEGYEDGSFRANNNITRQEVCVIINRIIKPMDLGLPVNITDAVADWAKTPVELIVMNMIMPLEENNTFRATENIKRYELATLLSNFVVKPIVPLTAKVRFFDGETQIGETDTVLIGDVPTVPDAPSPKEEGYVFAGWRVVGETELTDPKSRMVDGDVDYEAVYVKKTFVVEFYDGGTLFETVEFEYGAIATKPINTPENDGYDFEGWSFSDGGEVVNLEELVIVSDIKLYAVYKKQDDGSGGGPGDDSGSTEEKVYYDVLFFVDEEIYNTQSVLEGRSPKEPDNPEIEGKVFLGWSTKQDGDEDDVIDVTEYEVDDYTDFYAVFKVNPNDPELLKMLDRGIEQLGDIKFTKTVHKNARKAIVNCMKLVLADGKSGILITKEYVQTEYATDVEDVEGLVLDDMSGREASEFKTYITNNVDKDVRDFLSEYFLDGEDIEI